MYAPAGTLFRQAIADTEVAGHYIPRKSQVAINVYASMRLADWWPDPDRFDPARFLHGADAGPVHRYAFAPFGGGAHKCIGRQFADMNVKAIMHQLLRHFDWQVPVGYHPPMSWGPVRRRQTDYRSPCGGASDRCQDGFAPPSCRVTASAVATIARARSVISLSVNDVPMCIDATIT